MQSMYLTRRRASFLAAVCALACAFLASCGGGNKGDGAVRAYGIVIVDNAALRVDPLIYSARISLLKKGDKLEIIDQSKGKSTIGKNRDYWYKVRQRRGLSGWIYGANLKLFSLGTGYSMDSYIARLKEKGVKAVFLPGTSFLPTIRMSFLSKRPFRTPPASTPRTASISAFVTGWR